MENMDNLYLVVGWIILIAFAATLFITIGALINKISIKEFYLKRLFASLILEIIAAAFFLFYNGPDNKMKPYTGEWTGAIHWTDEWSKELMISGDSTRKFIPINPRAEGEVYIYSTKEGVYKCFATWTLKNSDYDFSKSAALGSNFIFSDKHKLLSFDFKAHSRLILRDVDKMGPSPLYKVVVEEESPMRIKGKMIIPQKNDKQVATIILEHR